MRTLELIAALTLLAATPPAAAQVPHTFTTGTPAKASEVNENFAYLAAQAPAVYWKPSPTCDAPCDFTATALSYPNDTAYTEIATLALPAGSYLVLGKLSAYSRTSIIAGDLECVLGVAGGANDYSSIGLAPLAGGEKMLGMTVPIAAVGASTTVRLGCRLYGTQADGTSLIRAQLWGAKIIAVRVASITQQ
jgi:hypothetical protein